MKKGNIILLGLGYAAGLLVALKFNKKGEKKDFEMLKKDIKEVHINLWTETEETLFSPENKEKIVDMKARALSEIEWFTEKADDQIQSMIRTGEATAEEILQKAQELYDDREAIIEKILSDAREYAETIHETSEDTREKLLKKINSVSKDVKKELASRFTKLKKKLK
jgi:hypothetical protein